SSTRSLPFIEEAEPAIPGSRSCAISFVFFIDLRDLRFPRRCCCYDFAGRIVVGAGAAVRMSHRGRSIMKRKSRIQFSLAALSAFIPLGHATTIKIEPDDYLDGTDLSNISSHVTLQNRYLEYDEGSGNLKSRTEAVYADSTRPLSNGDPAPTGSRTFGNFAYEGAGANINDDCCYGGFGMFFNEAVDRVSLLAVSWYPPEDLRTYWTAFDKSGNPLGYGTYGPGAYGKSFEVDIHLNGMWSLIIGGGDGTAAYEFDALTFDVPEPSPLSLSVLATAAIGWRMRRRRST